MLLLNIPWEEVKEKLKETNINLTDEDLLYDPAQEEEFLNSLAKKLKRHPEEIKGLIESISSNTGKLPETFIKLLSTEKRLSP